MNFCIIFILFETLNARCFLLLRSNIGQAASEFSGKRSGAGLEGVPPRMAENILKRYPSGGKARAILLSQLAVTAGNEATLKLGVRSDSSYSNHALLLRQLGFEPLVTIRPFGLTACYRGYRERHTRTTPYNTLTDPARSQPTPDAVSSRRKPARCYLNYITQLCRCQPFSRSSTFFQKSP